MLAPLSPHLRTLQEHFQYLHDTADKLQEDRLLANLPIAHEPPLELQPVLELPSPVKTRTMRKAPLDNMLTSCDCV